MTPPASISTPSACLALSPDGSTVACARGNVLQVFSVSSCQLLQEIQCHTDSITAVRYVGSSLLSVGLDGLVCIWDDAMGSSAPQTFRLHHPVLSSFACGRHDVIFLVVAKKFEAGSSVPAACAVYSLNVNKGGVVRKLFKCRGTCEIHGSADGKIGSRFYLHARNQADGLLHVLKQDFVRYGQADRPVKFNIVGEKEFNNLELAQLIAKFMGKPLKYEIVDFHSTRPGHDLRYALDGEKMKQAGWQPPLSFEESLESTIRWTLENPKWLSV